MPVQKLRQMRDRPHFEQLMNLLAVFQVLSTSNEVTVLNEQDTSIRLIFHGKIRMGSIYKYICVNYDKKPDVNAVAANTHLSTAFFCRYLKKQTKMTFTDLVNQYRITRQKLYY